MEERKTKTIFFLSLLFFSIISRILPHSPNFTPIGALSLLSGAYLPKKYSLFVPLSVMFLTDYFIGFYEIKLMISVYGSFILIVLIGFWLKNHRNFITIISSSLIASLLFYIITNFAVWAFTPWYEKNLTGLASSYLLALPFFRNTILGDLFYTFSFFSLYEFLVTKNLFHCIFRKREIFLINSNLDKIT